MIIDKKKIKKKEKAISLCMEKNESLTPNRLLILDILLESDKPISAYDINEAKKIIGKKSKEIPNILGYEGRDEIIHKDDLVKII